MLMYKGEQLQQLFRKVDADARSLTKCDEIRERDLVNSIRQEYFQKMNSKVLVVSGLKATGKTTGLLQAVRDFDSVLYITAQQHETSTGNDFIAALKDEPEQYIIIDQYSWIPERQPLDSYLCRLVQEEKRVAVTGTDSIVLDYLNIGSMCHRVEYINIIFFTYQEYCMFYHKPYSKRTCDDFIKHGAAFIEPAMTSLDDMTNYVYHAVIQNYSHYLGISEAKAKAVVYSIMYLAVCPSDREVIFSPESRKRNQRYQMTLERLGVDPHTVPDSFDLFRAGEILEKTHFVAKTLNMPGKNEEDCRFHLTNPSLAYQMTKAVFHDIAAEQSLSIAYEAYIASYLAHFLPDAAARYHTETGKECPALEIVIDSWKKGGSPC